MNINKILLPVDFQSAPSSLVHQAACIARHFRSAIVILNVVTPLSYSAGMLEGSYVPTSREDLLAELIRQARKDLDQCLRPELEGLPVERMLVEGDPAIEIVKASRNENADLIMMPTHGRKGFRRFLLGSVAAKVLHDSEIPVWTGAHLEEAPSSAFAIRNVVCGVDLGPHSRTTVLWAAQMAAAFHARLTLVHITAGLDTYSPAPEWRATLASLATQQIADVLENIGATGDVVIDSGDAAKLLNRIAVEKKADLLVVGRSPSPGHLGGTGYGIIRESRVPVVSVRQPQKGPNQQSD
jgi:nucleotide-binding universal stress UspA family protein